MNKYRQCKCITNGLKNYHLNDSYAYNITIMNDGIIRYKVLSKLKKSYDMNNASESFFNKCFIDIQMDRDSQLNKLLNE